MNGVLKARLFQQTVRQHLQRAPCQRRDHATPCRAMQSAAGAPAPPRPMPFAIARNAHEAIRGSLKDCTAAAAAGDAGLLKDEWAALKRSLGTHMAMEEGGFFPLLDAQFEGVVTAEGLAGEHEHDRAEQARVDAALAGGDAGAAAAAIAHFAAEHEKHLKHEEDVLMPLTMKVAGTGPERARAVNQHLLKPMVETGDFLWHLEWLVKKLVKHKPPEATRVFVWGLQHGSTEQEWATFLPIVKASMPAEMFDAMAAEFGIDGAGKVML